MFFVWACSSFGTIAYVSALLPKLKVYIDVHCELLVIIIN